MGGVFLARTPEGLRLALEEAAGRPVWCSFDALSPDSLRNAPPRNLTVFDHALPNQASVDDALSTIAEHHPRQVVWVEYVEELTSD